ncbi:MAG: malonyl-CoA decarboxylase [Gammaproteobacteria bacterium]|nr:malonyl-CoA decarboxylase [Gammaproteobacteria bacterium]
MNAFLSTLGNLRNAWRSIAGAGADDDALRVKPDLPDKDAEKIRQRIVECLQAKGGVVSAKARAAGLGRAYLDLDDVGKQRFLHILAHDFSVSRNALEEAITAYQHADTALARLQCEQKLRRTLRVPARGLLTQFNALPQGVKFLVDLRADLRRLSQGDAWMLNLDADLKSLLSSWFDIGFLDMRRLNWEAPATLLEKLIQYEAVHEIPSWDDLKGRLDAADRRVFAFFHPRMPEEPLIFVQVALSAGLATSVQTLLDPRRIPFDPERADTAVFYSISNTQAGLHGVHLGDFLIKRVVDHLQGELPRLKTFATLSPIPGFRDYVKRSFAHNAATASLPEDELLALEAHFQHTDIDRILAEDDWLADTAGAAALRNPLLRLAARYLVTERKRGRAANPVANFHLSNGARIQQLNWLADTSAKGLRESAGVMVNYLYKLSDIEKNHEAYRETCEIAVSNAVRNLLPQGA